jgi:predicted nucleic acid-binding protein
MASRPATRSNSSPPATRSASGHLRHGRLSIGLGGSSGSTERRSANEHGKRQGAAGPALTGGGGETTCTHVAALVDTNVLVYRFDPRFPDKQRIATELLRQGIAEGTLRLPHQALPDRPLLEPVDATQEVEELLIQFDVLYPNEDVLRLALRGAAAYQLSWFDAHLWAYAEHYGLNELLSEDFQHDRTYGTVRAVNPFADE